jgi:hypothetical protein
MLAYLKREENIISWGREYVLTDPCTHGLIIVIGTGTCSMLEDFRFKRIRYVPVLVL